MTIITTGVAPISSAAVRSFFLLPLAILALSACKEDVADINSEAACTNYCEKKFDCEQYDATNSEVDACVSNCRDSIEDNCGNDVQEDANAKIQECVDLSCDDFWPCMVFDDAPECFDFVEQEN